MTTVMQFIPRDLPPATTADNMIARLLLVAGSQIGYREGHDSSGWNNDNAYGKWYGTNGVSWCAQFVSWAAHVAGIPATVIPRHQYTPTGWNWFVANNRDVQSPRAGDILYVYGYVPGQGNRVHHVGIVAKVLPGGQIQTIEGNTNTTGSSQGNGVYRLTRIVTSKLRFARPDYAAAVQATPPPKTIPAKPPAGNTAKPPTPPEDQMTPAQMQELKNFIEARTQAYAIANNNYTRQVLGTTSKAIVAAARASDQAQADRILAELDTQAQADADASIAAVPAADTQES